MDSSFEMASDVVFSTMGHMEISFACSAVSMELGFS